MPTELSRMQAKTDHKATSQLNLFLDSFLPAAAHIGLAAPRRSQDQDGSWLIACPILGSDSEDVVYFPYPRVIQKDTT